MDRDSVLDLVSWNAERIVMLRGRGDGTFESERAIYDFLDGSYARLILGDANQDGTVDAIAVSSGEIRLLPSSLRPECLE
jgi:hypothetical protein